MSKLIKMAKDFIGECWHANFKKDCIFEMVSKNCLHQKTIGKCVGIESFITDCHDWSHAFPNYTTEVKGIEEVRGVVVCKIDRKGRHTDVYRSTNHDKKTILVTSNFFCGIENHEATGHSYHQPATVIFAFHNRRIAQIAIEEESNALLNQLGLVSLPLANLHADHLLDMQIVIKAINATLHTNLTLREVQCLAMSFCGFSAKHIADILSLSFRTVETYFQHIYHKLHCFGKQQVLDLMVEKQLLPLWLEIGRMNLNIKNDRSYGLFRK